MIFLLTALHYRDCVLLSKTEVNHDTHVFRLQLPRGTVMHVPVGKHVYLKALIQGEEPKTVLDTVSVVSLNCTSTIRVRAVMENLEKSWNSKTTWQKM